ncbi:amino acid adenylation domain-containing protein [Saccharothrix australiensis]|uniref:Amino acid adenylation domain-containing protein/thioester reductase-like protein n=1 Tax=Saccharothrix australiensis TaxID=2072 RepID=A0A495VVB1_9PSEU|nr:amino acid adenylation domain-containing protein [Saccharothrix australiensis]RKT52820.1 amino acid adenylation domain-containing protein/thioester reductase-like protein [Saccharothrix australiensis]
MELREMQRAEHLDRVREWNRTSTGYPRDALVHQLFLDQVEAAPDAVALSPEDGADLTYGELRRRADVLAAVLGGRGVRAGDPVAVALERSVDAYVAILAVLRAGGRWVPVDPDSPSSRVETVLRRAGCAVAVVPAGGDAGLPPDVVAVDAGEVTDAAPPPTPELTALAPAYVMFTSGSTGTPKGVVVPHRAVVRLARSTGPVSFRGDDVVCATVNPTFDMSVFELFGALLNGARLVVPRRETVLSAAGLDALLRRERVTAMWLGSALFHQFAAQRPGMFRGLRTLVAGGDALNPNVVRKLLAEGRPERLVDGYGPTENTGLSTAHVVDELPPEAEAVPIGRPISDSTAYVVREDGSPADVGEEGELWVGGDGVALGYLGMPGLTAQRFVADPFGHRDGGVLYRTGDVARWRRDGVLEFLGRRDRQVKIDGSRVELREIELVLASLHRVEEAVVALVEGPDGGEHLCGWVTVARDADRRALPSALRRRLRDRLPAFMVPTEIRVVDDMPLTSNGKVDRERLRRAAAAEPVAVDERDGPRTAVERDVASVWRRALGVPSVGRHDDFFALGGQSVQVAQVVAAVGDRVGIPPDRAGSLIRALLADPGLERFARRVEAVRDDTGRAAGDRGGADRGGADRGGAGGSGAATAADLRREARLPAGVRFTAPPAGDPTAPRRVLLTGASGFLGVHLLDRLVATGVREVWCLVRADDEAHARRRLAGRARRYGLDHERVADHVVPLPGDLSAPRLGLAEERYGLLAEAVDTVVHAGAAVNFAYPYESLRDSNVDGVRALLDLAAAPRLKAFHHVSTISVLTGYAGTGVRYVLEDRLPDFPERLALGYFETKWVAEALVREAARRGLPVTIHRPSEITGTRDRGTWNTDTFLCTWLRTIVDTGLAPDVALPLDLVPVDYTAEAIVHIVRGRRPDGRTHHLVNPRPARLALLVDRLRHRGYPVRDVPYAEWVRHVTDLSRADPYRPMTPYLPLFHERVAGTAATVEEMQFAGNFPECSRTNTRRATDGAGPRLPAVDADLLDTHLDFLARTGFLPTPPARREATRRPPADDPPPTGTALAERALPALRAHLDANPLAEAAVRADLDPALLRRFTAGEAHRRPVEVEALTRLARRFRGTPGGALFDGLAEAVRATAVHARAADERSADERSADERQADERQAGTDPDAVPAGAADVAAFLTALADDSGPGVAAAAVRCLLLTHAAVCAELGHALRHAATPVPDPLLRCVEDAQQVFPPWHDACAEVIARAVEDGEDPADVIGAADRVDALLRAYGASVVSG